MSVVGTRMIDTIAQSLEPLIQSQYWNSADRLIACYTTRRYAASDSQFARIKHPVKIDQAPTDQLFRGAGVKDVEAGGGAIGNVVRLALAGHHFVTYLPELQSGFSLNECRTALDRAGAAARGRVKFWVANWGLNEAQALSRLGGDVVAWQWASPTSNGGLTVPGTSKTIAQLNVDLSVVVKDFWLPAILPTSPVTFPAPRKASGTWKAELTHTPADGKWSIKGISGKNVKMAQTAETDLASVKVDLHTGQWHVQG